MATLEERVTKLEVEIPEDIDRGVKQILGAIHRLDTKVNTLDSKVERLDTKVDSMSRKLDRLVADSHSR